MEPNSTIGTLHERPGFLIRRLHQISLALFMETGAEFGITPTQFGVMHVLSASPGIDQGSLARALDLDRSTTALAVGNLEKRGLLMHRPAPNDRRRKILFLSEEGGRVFAAIREPLVATQNRVLSPLGEAEQHQFLDLLRKLIDGAAPGGADG